VSEDQSAGAPDAPGPGTDADAGEQIEPNEGHLVPCVSGGLLLHDTVTTSTSLKGVGDAILHPVLDAFLREIPVEHREMFRFNCAEATLVSNALIEYESSLGRELDWQDAVELCAGGTVFTRLVRDAYDPDHDAPAAPCKSCAYLLTALGIQVLES
jgi:hypothetical protein